MDLRHFLFSLGAHFSRAVVALFDSVRPICVPSIFVTVGWFCQLGAAEDLRASCDFDPFCGGYVHVVGRKCEAMP